MENKIYIRLTKTPTSNTVKKTANSESRGKLSVTHPDPPVLPTPCAASTDARSRVHRVFHSQQGAPAVCVSVHR